jgi:hypothetical protein
MNTTTNTMLDREGHEWNRLNRHQAYADADWLQQHVNHSKEEKARIALRETNWPVEYIGMILNFPVGSVRKINEREKLRR